MAYSQTQDTQETIDSSVMYKNLSEVLIYVSKAIEPYLKLGVELLNNIEPLLIDLAKVSKKFAVINRLGNLQFVQWNDLPNDLYDLLAEEKSDHDFLSKVDRFLSEKGYSAVDDTINKLYENDVLSRNHVFNQSVSAYRRGDYDIAALGFTAMIDRLLSVYSGMIKTVSIKNRIEAISKKIEKQGISELDDLDLNDYILVCTFTKALEIFGERVDFDKSEPELNRHWIAHGRMDRSMRRIDSIRLINMMYGVILICSLARNC